MIDYHVNQFISQNVKAFDIFDARGIWSLLIQLRLVLDDKLIKRK